MWAVSERASIAVYMAIMLPVLIASIGLSIDLAQAYLVRERLSRAVDAAALAVAGSTFSGTAAEQEAALQERVDDFMAANYPAEKIGAVIDVDVVVNGDDISVSASADYQTFFMAALGYNVLGVDARATVRKQVKGVEAVLVLDNTGSMSYTPPGETIENIEALQNAASLFVTTMFDKAQDPDDVRIGLVPYANSVRIGRYGLGLKPDGSVYTDRNGSPVEPFVTLPAGVSYTDNPSSSTGWYGCVVEHKETDYNSAATHVAGSYGQLWSTATGANSTKCSSSASCKGHGWSPSSGSNNPSPIESSDDYEGPWDIYMYGKLISQNSRCTGSGYSGTSSNCSACTGTYNGNTNTCVGTYCYCKYSSPNNSCPRSNVLPLTSNEQDLLTAISSMRAHGNTQGNAGMIWGSRLISPEPPFTEGSEWNSDYWSKAVIMMTDGDNTMDGTYSYYWATAKNDISVSGNSPKGLNQRFLEVCEALKAQHPPVLIYTIVFRSENEVSETNKQFYRDCATSDATYFDAPTQEDLLNTFQHIARELSNLHLTE